MSCRNTLTILCLVLTPCFIMAQADDNAARWKLIDSLVDKKGLTASALVQVNAIYAKAQSEKNDVQMIKALLYRMKLMALSQEDADEKAIADLEKQLGTARQPAKAIIESITAQVYWNYLQNNRYKLYSRTATSTGLKGDVTTWGLDDLHHRIAQLYLSSLQDEKLLQATRLDKYDPILIKGNVRVLRPTLFDLLAHRALDYFKTDEMDLNRPAYTFEIDDIAAFAPAAEFARHQFHNNDSSSLHYTALGLFQKLIQFHLADARPDALLDVDIERIGFVNQYGIMDNKEALYTGALVYLTDQYRDEPAAAQAWYLQAEQYFNKASVYRNGIDTSGHDGYIRAKAICDQVLAEKDSSEGKIHCQSLLNDILIKELNIKTEEVNLPSEPFRGLVFWRNLSHLYIRIVQVNHTMKEKLNAYGLSENNWKTILQWPVYRQMTQSLPVTDDYQYHRAEIKFDALPIGEYALIGCADSNFTLKKDALVMQFFYVSGIASVTYQRTNFVVDRKTGFPLPDATVQIWERNYNPSQGKNVLTKAETYLVDRNGIFIVNRPSGEKRGRQWMPEITTGNDHLFLSEDKDHLYFSIADNNNPGWSKAEYEKRSTRTFFFTDRSIYRPGQSLFFKGIVINRDADTYQPKVLSDFHTKLFLYDANHEKVDSLEVTTNAFGSYHGQFILPTQRLNGIFQLEDSTTAQSVSFSVEEYKRPGFQVTYDAQQKSHRPGDSILVTGNVQAYAGNRVDGATVQYHVRRRERARFPWILVNLHSPVIYNDWQEIAHGATKTDATGKFNIAFTAIPDRAISPSTNPVFDYQVTADVTDINGETRNGTTTVSAGYRTLELFVSKPLSDKMPVDSLKQLMISATDHTDIPQPVLVKVSIYALHAPDRLIRPRYWEQPDQFIFSKDAYIQYFPHDEYDDELNVAKWDRSGLVLETTDSAGKTLGLGAQHFEAGWYAIEAIAKDAYGQEIKETRYVALYDTRTGRPANLQYSWGLGSQQSVEPGGKARSALGTSADEMFVIQKVGSNREKDSTGATGISIVPLKKGFHVIEQPVVETDRGGFAIQNIFIKENRTYTQTDTINVPWTNKELTIHYTSYRDKTLPGSEEKWQVQISGHQSDKVAAEVLTGMYDASLDQFDPHAWSIPSLYHQLSFARWSTVGFDVNETTPVYMQQPATLIVSKQYDAIMDVNAQSVRRYLTMGRVGARATPMPGNATDDKVVVIGYGSKASPQKKELAGAFSLVSDSSALLLAGQPGNGPIAAPVRTDFRETAFFFPDLQTDAMGNVTFSFTMPEALTRWKWMTLAHTPDLSFGYSEKEIVTQKQLMVQANVPRFLREGDRLELPFKVVNMTDSEMTGQMALQLTDPTTGQTADGWFTNRQPNQYFTVGPKQSVVVNFPIDVPFQYSRPLSYRVMASAKEYSDGEEAVLPVVSNRILVTESLPLSMSGAGKRTFHFDKLLQSGSSETLNHYALTVEFTSNPTWYAVQALPYLMEYPYECAEQTFNRFYANALASKIVSSSPRIQQIFAAWRTTDTAALLSNLEKNQELKSILLEETPWVLQGKSETQQRKNIALLFDMARMSKELNATLAKLQDMQSADGGFPWFKDGPGDRYITQYILTGIAHLQKLQAIPTDASGKLKAIVTAALSYSDDQLKKEYEAAKKAGGTKTSKVPGTGVLRGPGISALQAQYLYMRSMFNDQGIPGSILPAVSWCRKQAQQGWLSSGTMNKGMIALALFRTGDVQTAKNIMASLKENAIRNEELGMYWKGMEGGGYYWNQAPIETEALMIEAFHEIAADKGIEKELKTWLLKQKQTNDWKTTKATADACYALLMGADNWLGNEPQVTIQLGDKTISTQQGEEGAVTTTAGTGYFKKVFDGPFVHPDMGNITVSLTADQQGASVAPAWGAVYWQYFDMLDKITASGSAKAPLQLVKKLFVERHTDKGTVLEPVVENGVLHPGDKVKVRIELQTDRDLEYVHMKDMRAACMEPVNVLSGYQWQGGLGYYQSTKDASTDFFFSWIPRGAYIFEYPLYVGQTGDFSNGITTIECMYAPEFGGHSEGVRVNVEQAPR